MPTNYSSIRCIFNFTKIKELDEDSAHPFYVSWAFEKYPTKIVVSPCPQLNHPCQPALCALNQRETGLLTQRGIRPGVTPPEADDSPVRRCIAAEPGVGGENKQEQDTNGSEQLGGRERAEQ